MQQIHVHAHRNRDKYTGNVGTVESTKCEWVAARVRYKVDTVRYASAEHHCDRVYLEAQSTECDEHRAQSAEC